MHLVALLQSPQDRDGVLDRRLIHVHRLEAPLQRRVLLNVLSVLVQRGSADRAQLAARQRRLQEVGGVDRALRGTRSDQGVQLVDEEDDLALRILDLLQHRLEPVFELPAVLGPGHQGAQVERDHPLVLQPLGHVAGGDALGQALGDRGLPHSGLADQDRVVLGAPAQHLDDPPDLLVAADDRVELPAACEIGEVAPVLLQRLVLPFRVGVGDAL